MEKKYFIYDRNGLPSSQSFSIDEIKEKHLPSDTIVCPEFGQPSPLSGFPELLDWVPPKLEMNKKNSSSTWISKRGVIVAVLLFIVGCGAMYMYKSKIEHRTEIVSCVETKRKLGIQLDSLRIVKIEFNKQTAPLEKEISTLHNQLNQIKTKIINLENGIPLLEERKQQEITNRDKTASEICYLQSCIDKRAATVKRFNESINSIHTNIASNKTEIQKMQQINIPELENKIDKINDDLMQLKQAEDEIDLRIKEVNNGLALKCNDRPIK